MRNVTGRKQEPLAAGWRGIIEPDGTLKLHNGARSIDRATIVVRIPPDATVALGLWLLRTILTRAPASTSESLMVDEEDEDDDPPSDLQPHQGPAVVALPGGAEAGRGLDGGVPELQPSRLAAEEG